MASARDLRKKIKSVTNTKKITRTMELVATSKAKRAQDRVVATRPYSEKLAELLQSLAQAGTVEHPLLRQEGRAKRTALLIVTSNRGYCGGYNVNVMHMAEKLRSEELAAGREVDVYAIGGKAVARLRYLNVPAVERYTHFDDRPSFLEVAEVGGLLMRRFLAGEVDRVLVVSTRFISAGTQRAQLSSILPIQPPREDGEPSETTAVEFIFEPDPQSILDELLPLSVQNAFYRLLVEAAASEQIARRIAMKRATDSADEIIDFYRKLYNRTRQAGITQQINEIVSGASALE